MGVISPLQNVKAHSASKPPLVVFVICILLFACTILTMAFYIQYADTILNPEIKVSWKKFLTHLDSFRLCFYTEEQSSEDEILALSQFMDGGVYNTTSSDKTVSITIALSLILLRELQKLPTGMVAVTGRIDLDGLFEEEDEGSASSSLNMTFVIPQNLTRTRYKDTCVILTGPPWLLQFSRRFNVCVPSSVNRTITHLGTLIPVKQEDADISCKNGSPLKLSYSNQSDDEFYLSKEEKWHIYTRLIHASYFLFIASLTFMCYSMLRGRMYRSAVKIDKTPLTL